MNDKSYIQMMSDAYIFTKEIGLDVSDIKISHLPCPIEEMGEEIFTEFLFRRKIPLQNLGFNCIPWSIEACRFLKRRYNIHPILTSGSLLRCGNLYIHQPKDEIADLLNNEHANVGPAKFHTWLTLENYILDITIMTTEWLIDETRKKYRYAHDQYCQIIASRYISQSNMLFTYHPIFLGENYFNRVQFIPKEHTLIFNTNPESPESIR